MGFCWQGDGMGFCWQGDGVGFCWQGDGMGLRQTGVVGCVGKTGIRDSWPQFHPLHLEAVEPQFFGYPPQQMIYTRAPKRISRNHWRKVNRVDVVAALVDKRTKLHAIALHCPGIFDAHQIGIDHHHASAMRLQVGRKNSSRRGA